MDTLNRILLGTATKDDYELIEHYFAYAASCGEDSGGDYDDIEDFIKYVGIDLIKAIATYLKLYDIESFDNFFQDEFIQELVEQEDFQSLTNSILMRIEVLRISK